ncbi:MAG: plasmid mobilization relaxosome protein MobC [Bacteroidota bacterium]
MAQTKKKSEKRQRNNLKSFRLSDEELAAFLSNCEAANLSGGDLFRTKCCGQKPLHARRQRGEEEKLLAKILGQLGKYGNNLNQIAYALNIAKYKPDAAATLYALQAQEEKLEAIHTSVDLIRDLLMNILLKHDPRR